jgi:tetratricopeptide (TPR) repeat protein
MEKRFLITGCIALLFWAVCFGDNAPLANEKKDGLYVKSIEQVLRLEPEQIDIGTAALIVSEQWSDMVPGRKYQDTLDEMAIEVRSRLKDKKLKTNYQAIPVINEYLFDELSFTSVEKADDPNDLFLHHVIDNKKGYCLSLSILYLAIGERLGLPLYGVVVPGHFFVRYDDGTVRFNIETTSKGGSASDEHYINKFKVPKDTENSVYLKNLTPQQSLGCFFNNLGNSYQTIGNNKQAQAALERAVEINPSLSESRINLGNIYLQAGRIDEAIGQYKQALRYNPVDGSAHNNLGNAYLKKGLTNDAISQYTQTLKIDPNFIEAYKNLAIAYCQNKIFPMAVEQMKRALILEPKNAALYQQLADIYREKQDYNQAIKDYKTALGYNKQLAESYYGIALCCKALGRPDDEIAGYKMALQIQPNMLAAINDLGNAYFSSKKYDQAIEQYKLAAQIKPDEALIYYNIGAAFSNKNEYAQAIEAYLKAIAIKPDAGDAHYGLAYCYYNQQQYQLSLKHLKTARQLGVKIDENLLKSLEENLKRDK